MQSTDWAPGPEEVTRVLCRREAGSRRRS
jgi:hypothetical protein